MLEKIKQVAQMIIGRESKLAERASQIKSSGIIPACTAESKLVFPVSDSGLDCSVCGIDGGLLYERLHGIDLLLGRAVAVNFVYEKSAVKSFSHFPSRFPEHSLELKSGLDEHEAGLWKSLFRLKKEISVAISTLDKFSPEIILLDGSILPLPSDRPAESSSLFEEYIELVSLFGKLYSECKKRDCILAGVIKDTRAKRLVELVDKSLDVPDTVFAGHLLDEKERTCAFSYSDNKSQPVLKDLEEHSGTLKVFYLRPSKEDIPLRIEYLDCGKSADEIASSICSLSSVSRSFAYPAVLIEADLCAAMDSVEMEGVKKQLFALSKGGIRPLRRNSRPFR